MKSKFVAGHVEVKETSINDTSNYLSFISSSLSNIFSILILTFHRLMSHARRITVGSLTKPEYDFEPVDETI
jgi:hypothetical protein